MKRRVIIALSTAGVLSAGAVGYILAGGAPAASSGSEPGPGQVHTLALSDMSGGAQHPVMGLTSKRTQPFSLLGVSWDNPRTAIDGAVQVRTRSTGRGTWSPWQPVEAHSDDGPGDNARTDSQVRGATSPLWVGPSNGVQVRVTSKRSALPQGLRLEMIDPGDGTRRPGPRAAGHQPGEMTLAAAVSTDPPVPDPPSSPTAADPTSPAPADPASPAQPASPSADPSAPASVEPSAAPPASPSASASPTASAPPSTAPRPAIVSRARWGADETLVTNPASYAPSVKAVFVHHTAGTNDYTCDQSPALVRSILLYHVKTNGWDDVGYNFLVDKCGTIFEGRKGGVDRPVIGAHTYGFNTGSSGVSVLGDFEKTAPTQATLSAVARIAAWKLGLHGGNPTGKAVLTTPLANGKFPAGTSVNFNTISGHRDGYATECPGKLLYDKLGTVRTEAKQWSTPVTSLALTGISGATKVGGTYFTKGSVTLGWKPAAVSGYQVVVDGTVVAGPDGSASSAKATLASGSHSVVLRATNINGSTVSSPTYPVVADTTAPVFSTPAALALRTGTVSTAGSVPVRLGWKVTDNRQVRSVKATSPSGVTFTPTTTSWSAYAKAGSSPAWTLTAADAAGNTAGSTATRTTSLVYESSSVRTGTWKTSASSQHLGSRAYYSSAKNATAAYTFTGRSVGLVATRATNFGAFYVYVDGVKTASVDTKGSSTAYRQILWTKTWSTSAKHTIKIVVAGTSGRPTVVTDGIAYIK